MRLCVCQVSNIRLAPRSERHIGATKLDTERDAASPPPSAFLGHQTAKAAIAYLEGLGEGFHQPSRAERDALLIAFARARMPLHGAAFDLVKRSAPIDLSDPDMVYAGLDDLVLCEVKSTNRASIRADFAGYFFNITAGELLTAQALGARYRFLFVNTVSKTHVERSLQEVLGAARGLYPAWHIRF